MADRPSTGSNLPSFRAVQLDFAAHIRNPDKHPRPEDIEARRMQIYLDLFYNNIEGFLASTFPVAKRVLGETRWHELARQFVHEHPSESPYFLDISQEYLTFLGERQPQGAPDFLLELCHYEWVELSLKVDEREIPDEGIAPAGDLARDPIVLNPLLWTLSYRYPVTQIRPDNVPQAPPAAPTLLVVYRDRQDQIRFRGLNPLGYQLLQALGAAASEAPRSGEAVLAELQTTLPHGQAMSAARQAAFTSSGLSLLRELAAAEVILGTVAPEPHGS